MIEDFCKFFAMIEADPHALVKDLTIRDYLLARQHVQICKKCFDSTERVLAKEREEHGNNDGCIEFSGN